MNLRINNHSTLTVLLGVLSDSVLNAVHF